MADEARSRDFLEWTPFAGSVGLMAAKIAQEGELEKLGKVWRRGQRAGKAMQAYVQELSRQQAAGLVLPQGLSREQEAFILEVARHATGTRERLAHVQTFAQAEALRETVPEFYRTVVRQAWALKEVDPAQLLRGEALAEAVPETADLVSTVHIRPRQLDAFLEEVERRRQAGRFKEPFLQAREAFQEAFNLPSVRVEAVKRRMRLQSGQETEQLIALRMSGRNVAVEIPVLTANREFITRTGAVYMPSFWELGEREIAPDVRILEELVRGLQGPLPADPQAYLDDLVFRVAKRSVYEVNERARDVASPLARLWLRGRAVVPGETPLEIARQREEVARQAWRQGRRDRTSGLPAGASQTGLVFRRSFRPEEWSSAGRLVDDKFYKTFAKSMPLARESREFLEQAWGRTRLAHLLTPPEAARGYYQAAAETGERLLNLNYGLVTGEELAKAEEQFRRLHKGRYDRRLFLQMTEDEIIMAAELKDAWKAERPVSYVLDETYGLSAAVTEGKELSAGEFLGISPMGRPVYAGRRGGREFVEAVERAEGKVTVRVRNLITPETGTKVFGTGGLKHTVRQYMRLSSLQALYAYILRNFRNIPGPEARRLARSVTALTIEKGFKSPEQEVNQLLSSLAARQLEAEAAGLPEAEEAARLLQRFGYRRAADRTLAGWERVDFSVSPEEIFYNFRAAERYDPEGVLAAAARRSRLVRSELIRMGPPMQDLGVGNPATFSVEMANVLFDQGRESLAAHLLGRTEQEYQQALRGLSQMLEPFEGERRRFGVDARDLRAEQLRAGEQGVADWLAHRGPDFPEEGIIHFRPYELPGGRTVSYLKLPEESLASLQGVYLEEGRTAASVLQRSFYKALSRVRADVLHQPGTAAYQEAAQALQEYYDVLGRLILGKQGAARAVTGGRVAHSLQLQAASLFSGLPKEPATMYVTDEAAEQMLRGLPAEQAAGVLQVVDPQGRYGSLLEAFRAGEPLPGIAARYPAESSFAALPVRFRSANWALRQVRAADLTRGPFTLGSGQIYIDPELFKLMTGDYDADVVHAFLAVSGDAAREINRMLGEGQVEEAIQYWQANLRTTSVKGRAHREFTNTLRRVLARQHQQRAGKADIGLISNALNRIREAARMSGSAALSDWTALIAESLTIKAKHHSLDRFSELYNLENIIAHLEGTGLGMTPESRVDYLLGVLREMDPTLPVGDFSPVDVDFKPIVRGGKIVSYPGLRTKLTAALEAYDRAYRRSAWDRITRLFKRPAAQATGEDAVRLLREAGRLTNDHLGALLMGTALDAGGWRSRLRHRLTGLTAAVREAGQILGRHGKWLGWGLAASAGLAVLRSPKPLTPEQVTGEELQQEGALPPPPAVAPPPTARVTPRMPGLKVRVRGRAVQDLPYGQLGQAVSRTVGQPVRVTVDDRSRRLTREDLRRLRRR